MKLFFLQQFIYGLFLPLHFLFAASGEGSFHYVSAHKKFSIQKESGVKIIKMGSQCFYQRAIKPFPHCKFIKNSFQKIIVDSVITFRIFEKLQLKHLVVGVNGLQYLSTKENKLELSSKSSLELLKKFRMDALFTSSLDTIDVQKIKLLDALNVTVIKIPDVEEDNFMDRLEWIIFYASFFDLEERAIELFNAEKERYLKIKNECRGLGPLLIGSINFGKWSSLQEKSPLRSLFRDAGAQLICAKEKTSFTSFSLESIYIEFKNQRVSQKLLAENVLWFPLTKWKIRENIQEKVYYEKLGIPFDHIQILNTGKRNDKNSDSFWENGILNPSELLQELCSLKNLEQKRELKWFHLL